MTGWASCRVTAPQTCYDMIGGAGDIPQHKHILGRVLPSGLVPPFLADGSCGDDPEGPNVAL